MLKKCRIFSALSDRIALTSKPGSLKFCPDNCPGGCYCFAFPDSIYHVAQDVQVFNIYNYYKIIFPNDKDYQMSKIERQYKRISENYKDADIEGLKVSNKAVKIMGML